jgi:phage-related tail fiber protein
MAAIDRLNGLASETTLGIKAPCLVATTGANIPLTGVQAVDGVTVGNNNERVLVKDQTDATTNGIYIASTGNWVYAQDAGGNTDWTYGTQVLVAGGVANANTNFRQNTNASPVIIGTTALTFAAVAIAASPTFRVAGGWNDIGTAYITRVHDRLFVDQGYLNTGALNGRVSSPLTNTGAGASIKVLDGILGAKAPAEPEAAALTAAAPEPEKA